MAKAGRKPVTGESRDMKLQIRISRTEYYRIARLCQVLNRDASDIVRECLAAKCDVHEIE